MTDIKMVEGCATQNQANIQPDFLPSQVLSENFKQLMYELCLQGFANQIPNFFESDVRSQKLRTWIREMEKLSMALGGDFNRLKVLAIHTIKGVAAEFASRILRETPSMSWQEFKDQLLSWFSDQSDSQYALQQMRKLKR